MQRLCPLAIVVLLWAVPSMAQETTGRLIGTVIDNEGVALPGVSVAVSSPALIGGAQTKTTDGTGEFRFLGLAPGEYTVRTELSGYLSQEWTTVKVSLGQAVALTIAMPLGTFSGEINVVDETPVVDPTQVHTGQMFDEHRMQASAIGSVNRDYLVVVNQAAGVVGGASQDGFPQPRVFGSTPGENAYFIDGMDTTKPLRGTASGAMNFDAIGEI